MTQGPETSYRVRGGAPLHGTVFVQGAKNAALKMIAASLLTANGHTVLRNVPAIEDVRRAVELAEAVADKAAVVLVHVVQVPGVSRRYRRAPRRHRLSYPEAKSLGTMKRHVDVDRGDQ